MKVIYRGSNLTESEKSQIWEILCQCDHEFYPSLSARESSAQKGLIVKETIGSDVKPVTYYNEMIQQEFLIAVDEETEQVTGFMTFKSYYNCEALEAFGESLYITTVCVKPECRKQGVMDCLYNHMEQEMPEKYSCSRISTRTWSLNEAQIHSLGKRGYMNLAVLKDDRGPGVDTIYYGIDMSK